jgi:hypothetical protein
VTPPPLIDADPRFDMRQHGDEQSRTKTPRTITIGVTERFGSGCLERVCCSDADGPPARKFQKRAPMNPLGRIGMLWHSIGPTTSPLSFSTAASGTLMRRGCASKPGNLADSHPG